MMYVANIYSPLNGEKKEIRLLTIHSGTGALHCSIATTPLDVDPKPSYETISYCWGYKQGTETIYVDDNPHTVPASAAGALECVRRPDSDRVVWLDSVCINQSDVTERGLQVAIMGDIYRNSVGNLIYLGEDNGSAELALQNCDEILQEIRYTTDDFRNLRQEIYSKPGSYRFSSTPTTTKVEIDALTDLFALPWFRRLWIVQEAALAPHNTCFYGRHQFDLTNVLRVAVWLFYKSNFLPKSLVFGTGVRRARDMWDLVDPELGAHSVKSGKTPNMQYLLPISQPMLVTEPRDKVYGILGLTSRLGVSEELLSLLKPDYRRPLADIYRDAARFTLFELGNLSVLDDISHRSDSYVDISEFPSWTPQWHRRYDSEWDCIDFAGGYNASGQSNQPFNISDQMERQKYDPGVLVVTGMAIDHLIWVSEVFTHSLLESPTQLFRNLQSIQTTLEVNFNLSNNETDPLMSDPDSPPPWLHDLAVTLIADRDASQRKADQTTVEAGCLFLSRIHNFSSSSATISESTPDSEDEEQSPVAYRCALVAACHNRRFFLTRAGHIGLGPRCMSANNNIKDREEGSDDESAQDVLSILHGGEWPFILRAQRPQPRSQPQIQSFTAGSENTEERNEGIKDKNEADNGGGEGENQVHSRRSTQTYVVLGQAYAHGMMYGEVTAERAKDHQGQKYEVREFWLV